MSCLSERDLWEKEYRKVRLDPVQRYDPSSFSVRVVELLDSGARILELGCGLGGDSVFFALKGFEVHCIDFSESAIECSIDLIDRYGLETMYPLVHDISEVFPFGDDCFDAFYAHLSLHYFDDETTTKVFDDIYRVLKRNGILFAKVKSIKAAKYGLGEKMGENIYHHHHLRHFFSKEYLEEKTQRFTTIELQEVNEKIYNTESAFLEIIAKKP